MGTMWQNRHICINKLQKQAARLILDADKYSPSRPLFDLKWETFDKIVQVNKP